MSAKLTGSVFAGVLLAASFSAAAENCAMSGSCKIPVTFVGTYLAQTCDVYVNTGGASGSVILPTIAASTLQTAGSETGSTQFPITLKNCPVSRTVAMRFTTSSGETADSVTGNLMNITGSDFSRDIQVRVRNIDGVQMRIDDSTSSQEYLIPASGDEVTHYFIASYYAKHNATVNAGRVQTRSVIDLNYY